MMRKKTDIEFADSEWLRADTLGPLISLVMISTAVLFFLAAIGVTYFIEDSTWEETVIVVLVYVFLTVLLTAGVLWKKYYYQTRWYYLMRYFDNRRAYFLKGETVEKFGLEIVHRELHLDKAVVLMLSATARMSKGIIANRNISEKIMHPVFCERCGAINDETDASCLHCEFTHPRTG